jgi:hypothetical protein
MSSCQKQAALGSESNTAKTFCHGGIPPYLGEAMRAHERAAIADKCTSGSNDDKVLLIIASRMGCTSEASSTTYCC